VLLAAASINAHIDVQLPNLAPQVDELFGGRHGRVSRTWSGIAKRAPVRSWPLAGRALRFSRSSMIGAGPTNGSGTGIDGLTSAHRRFQARRRRVDRRRSIPASLSRFRRHSCDTRPCRRGHALIRGLWSPCCHESSTWKLSPSLTAETRSLTPPSGLGPTWPCSTSTCREWTD